MVWTLTEMANSIKVPQNSLPLGDLIWGLQVDVKDLKKYLKSLALSKEKILLKSGDPKDISPDDQFRVRHKFFGWLSVLILFYLG